MWFELHYQLFWGGSQCVLLSREWAWIRSTFAHRCSHMCFHSLTCTGGRVHINVSCSTRAEVEWHSWLTFLSFSATQGHSEGETAGDLALNFGELHQGCKPSCPEVHLYKGTVSAHWVPRTVKLWIRINPFSSPKDIVAFCIIAFSKSLVSLWALHLTCSVIPTCLLLSVEEKLR